MNVKVAKSAGFCFGVKRAIKIAFETVKQARGPVYTLGPLIHNPQMVARLEELGVKCADRIPAGKTGTLIIRSHGVSPQMRAQIQKAGLTVVDATCPFVKTVQQHVERLRREGYTIVIVGEADHPEVQALRGFGGPGTLVMKDQIDLTAIRPGSRVGVVAQTTALFETFRHVVCELMTVSKELKVHNTICTATLKRQAAALELAQAADVMVVIGGKNSGNTQRLAESCRAAGKPTHHIETFHELNPAWFKKARLAGLTAGASTPDWIIAEVKQAMVSKKKALNNCGLRIVDTSTSLSASCGLKAENKKQRTADKRQNQKTKDKVR